MTLRSLIQFGLPVSLLLTTQIALAQTVDISECRNIEDRLERFACYENLESGGSYAAQPEEDAAPPDANQVSTQRANENVEDFGRQSARVQDRNGQNELHDTIAALEERQPNTWLVTLESGQQWLQMESKRYPMRVGDEVRIYPTRWGKAYRLSVERISSFIQVERID